MHRSFVAIYGLKVLIPGADSDYPLPRSVWQGCPRFEKFPQIVSVRIDCDYLGIDREPNAIADDEVAASGRNIQFSVVLKLEQIGEAHRRLIREVESDNGLLCHCSASGLHVDVQVQ